MDLTRTQALDLLKQYNKDPFHIRHALTVEAVMGWFARELGYGDEAGFWSAAGLLFHAWVPVGMEGAPAHPISADANPVAFRCFSCG